MSTATTMNPAESSTEKTCTKLDLPRPIVVFGSTIDVGVFNLLDDMSPHASSGTITDVNQITAALIWPCTPNGPKERYA